MTIPTDVCFRVFHAMTEKNVKDRRIPVWEKTFFVHSYESDGNSEARLTALCNYFQESAWEHAENLSFGYNDLGEHNLLWVLSRFYVEIDRYPKWTEEIIVETWPKGIDRLFALRDFLLKNRKGEIYGKAVSAWLILDIEKRRPQKAEMFRDLLNIIPNKSALEYRFGKLPQITRPDWVQPRSVNQSDIDPNNHANNVKFIEWIIDAESSRQESQHVKPKSLEIHYLAEGFFGQKCEIYSAQSRDGSGTRHYEARRHDDQAALFRGSVNWQ